MSALENLPSKQKRKKKKRHRTITAQQHMKSMSNHYMMLFK